MLMRKRIATAMVCLSFCITTNIITSTTFAHNHQNIEMMIEEDSLGNRINQYKMDIEIYKPTNDSIFWTTQQQKSNQTHVVKRVTYYYPTGNKTSTGHNALGHERIIALSPDLLEKIPYHSKVEVEGYGVFLVEDKTSDRLRNTVDILVPKGTKIKNGKNVVIRVIS